MVPRTMDPMPRRTSELENDRVSRRIELMGTLKIELRPTLTIGNRTTDEGNGENDHP